MDIEKRPGRAFLVEEHGVPSYDELILVAGSKTWRPAACAALSTPWKKGVQYLVNHPDELAAVRQPRPGKSRR